MKTSIRQCIQEFEGGGEGNGPVTVLLRDGSILADARLSPGSYRSTQDLHTDVALLLPTEKLEDARKMPVVRVWGVIVSLEEPGVDLYVSS